MDAAEREAAEAQRHAAECDEQAVRVAASRAGSLFFCVPERLPAGRPARLYVARSLSAAVAGRSRALASGGFNDWQLAAGEVELRPSGLRTPGGEEWWVADLPIPADAFSYEFALTDGAGAWDNNSRQNYKLCARAPALRLPSRWGL